MSKRFFWVWGMGYVFWVAGYLVALIPAPWKWAAIAVASVAMIGAANYVEDK